MDDEQERNETPENSPAQPGIEIMASQEERTDNTTVSDKVCLNCGTKLLDIYCHQCGQKDIPRRQTVGDTFMNFISSNWSFEGKFFRTTKYLLTKPGFLAVEYNAGRRERYFHPARMYVFISFVFFLLFFSLPDTQDTGMFDLDMNDYKEVRRELKNSGLDTIMNLERAPDSVLNRLMPVIRDSLAQRTRASQADGGVKYSLSGVEYSTIEKYDSAQRVKPEGERDGVITQYLMRRTIFMNQKYKGNLAAFSSDMSNALAENFSKILFWLLPLFALLLKLLYIRRDYYYSEHLVFSVFYYDFIFLAGSIYLLAAQVNDTWLTTLIGTWMYFYLLFAMKRMYGQGWGKTILKLGIFTGLFFVLFIVAFGITLFAIMLTM